VHHITSQTLHMTDIRIEYDLSSIKICQYCDNLLHRCRWNTLEDINARELQKGRH